MTPWTFLKLSCAALALTACTTAPDAAGPAASQAEAPLSAGVDWVANSPEWAEKTQEEQEAPRPMECDDDERSQEKAGKFANLKKQRKKLSGNTIGIETLSTSWPPLLSCMAK